MMSVRTLKLSVALAVTLVVAAGASSAIARKANASSTKKFSESGIGITFSYPSAFQVGKVTSVKTHVGATASKQYALVLDNANLLAVISYPNLKIAVTAKNLEAVAPQFNAALTKAFGKKVTGKPSTDHGIPLLSYPALLTAVPGGKGYDQVYYAFVNKTAYELLCQWTKGAEQAKIQTGCREMISTLAK